MKKHIAYALRIVSLSFLFTFMCAFTAKNSLPIPEYTPEETTLKTQYITPERVEDLPTVETEPELSTELTYISTTEPPQIWRYELTEYEAALIAYMIGFEENDFDALTGCAEVVLNRVESNKFPDTVEDVLFQPKQFYGAKFLNRGDIPVADMDSDTYKAVIAVFMDGISIVQGALFFASETVPRTKIANRLYEAAHINQTRFWRQE